ncbi:hypothetical protein LTR56_006215 [Elasticomyces elasticus]|nr:hypothetical protein LTR56_006215 [Elasticomyces elasticus]KAK3666576.1 hypothetical protein LTR22_002520 [Elasticomyces elasticus]KAK4928291.1 hypothetical protein LTR49_004968 [Elasticomyces elasticus]KAK5763854.1 hypothetical protein LTS12_005972 [Elasticomyces elasticus]
MRRYEGASSILVELRSFHGETIDEYVDPSPARPTGLVGAHHSTLVAEQPGTHLDVRLGLMDYDLMGAEGVKVTLAFGHGRHPPGGFQHLQYKWIDGKVIDTHHIWLRGFEVWEETVAGMEEGFVEEPYVMPVPLDTTKGEGVPTMREGVFGAREGSIFVHVVRGYLSPRQSLAGAHARIVTEPSSVVSSKPRLAQQLRVPGGDTDLFSISDHVFHELRSNVAGAQVFEFRNTGIDHTPQQLELVDKDVDLETTENDAGSESEVDASDEEWEPRAAKRDRQSCDTLGKTKSRPWRPHSRLGGSNPKRKRNATSNSKNNKPKRRRFGQACGVDSDLQKGFARLATEDVDDEENLPRHFKNEDADRKGSASDQVASSSQRCPSSNTVAPARMVHTAPAPESVPSPVEEDLHGDSRRPSLYNEPSSGARLTPAGALPEAAEEEDLYGDSRHPSLYNEAEPNPIPTVLSGAGTASADYTADYNAPQRDSTHTEGENDADMPMADPQQPLTEIVDLTMADSDDEDGSEDERAEVERREASLKVAQAEKEAVDARLALERKRRDRAKKDRAREMQRQAEADREERMKIKMELKVESTE